MHCRICCEYDDVCIGVYLMEERVISDYELVFEIYKGTVVCQISVKKVGF